MSRIPDGTTIENLTLRGVNESLSVHGSNQRIINVNTNTFPAGALKAATQPNTPEVYGSGIWFYRIGGTANSNSATLPAITILNDNTPQPPGNLDFENLVVTGCIDAHSVVSAGGSAGTWMFRNVSAEDCNTPLVTIDDDGSHPWGIVGLVTIENSGI